MRITQRGSTEVSGIFTTPDGQTRFRYDSQQMLVFLEESTVAINEYGWEVGQAAGKSAS